MRLIIKIALIFYVIVIFSVGLTGMLLLAHIIDLKPYTDFLSFIYRDPQAGIAAGFVIAATMLISYLFALIIHGRQERERIISFDNPLGRVTISLSAIEDLVRRLVVLTPQIREIRPDITSSKRGLRVDLKLVLRSDVNIPELTANLQDIIRRRIQDLVGGDERVTIRVHVIKISTDTLGAKKDGGRDYDDEDVSAPTVPFHGYRA